MSPQIVDIWIRDLDAPGSVPASDKLLAPQECTRAATLRGGQVRDRWVTGRSTLRAILARELDLDPREVELAPGPHGKPHLPDSPLHFNVSHSGPLFAVAVTRAGPVGLDVELVLKLNELAAVANRICDPGEMRAFEAQPEEEGRLRAFYRIWTAKEALLKGAGVGFAVSPSEVHLDLSGSSPRLAEPVPPPLGDEPWHLDSFDLSVDGSWAPAGAVGAVALPLSMRGPSTATFRIRRWTEDGDR